MADKEFTFLAFHLHDSNLQFGPKSIGDGLEAFTDDEQAATEQTGHGVEVTGDDESGGGGLPVGKALFALVVVAALAYAARTVLGGDEELSGLEDLDESL